MELKLFPAFDILPTLLGELNLLFDLVGDWKSPGLPKDPFDPGEFPGDFVRKFSCFVAAVFTKSIVY